MDVRIIILRCAYGEVGFNNIDEFKKVSSLFTLFNEGFQKDIDEKAVSFHLAAKKSKNKTDTIQEKKRDCPEYVFWFRLFQLLLSDDLPEYVFSEIGKKLEVNKEPLFRSTTFTRWRDNYCAVIRKEKESIDANPLDTFVKLRDQPERYLKEHDVLNFDLTKKLISGPLAEYLISIYSSYDIHTIEECENKGNNILKTFMYNNLINDFDHKKRELFVNDNKDDINDMDMVNEVIFKEAIVEFTKEFVNTIRRCLGLPNEDQIVDTIIRINDDSKRALFDSSRERIGQKYYDAIPIFERNNRFMFNSGKLDFQGRTTEIDTIIKMCESDEPFLWLGITGRGGMGKSRLAYHICSKLKTKKEKWITFEPKHSIKKLENLDFSNDNVFICFDYVKYYYDAIKEYMVELLDNSIYNIGGKGRVRIVLIERNPKDIEFSYGSRLERFRYRNIPKEIASADNGAIELRELSSVDYSSMIKQYYEVYTGKKTMAPKDVKEVYNKFVELDNELKRPLFALFITDAKIAGADLTNWDEKDALKYFWGKELSNVEWVVNKYIINDRIKNQKYYKAIRTLLGLATYFDGIDLREHSGYIHNKYGINADDEALNNILTEIGALSAEKTVSSVKPDLIGEYSTIEFFDSQSREETESFIEYVINCDLNSFLSHTSKLYDDYHALIDNKEWAGLIKTINFPHNINYVRHHLFNNNNFIEEVILHGQVYEIGVAAFMNAKKLKRMVLPSSVEVIEKNAFNGCISLTEFICEEAEQESSSLVKIYEFAFNQCSSLESIVLPSSLQHIEKAAFCGCTKLKGVVIPKKIKTIPDSCFSDCSSLCSCELPEELYSIGDKAFSGSGITCLTLPPAIKELGRESFLDCSMLEYVSVSETSSLEIGNDCFNNCTKLSDIDLKNVLCIGNLAFRKCESLVSVVMMNRELKLGEGAFMDCTSLKSADMMRISIKELPINTFRNCRMLTDVRLPDSIKRINTKAFSNCSALNKITLPPYILEIEKEAFCSCISLREINLPDSLECIRPKAFLSCQNIKPSCFMSLQPEKMKDVCGFTLDAINYETVSLFTLDADVKRVDIPATVTMINNNAFRDLKNLIDVTIRGNITLIGKNAFTGCSELRELDLGKSCIKSIGRRAFSGCIKLSEITAPLYIDTFESDVFADCESLKEIKVNNTIREIRKSSFLHCKNITILENGKALFKDLHHQHYMDCLEVGIPIIVNNDVRHNKCSQPVTVDGFEFGFITKNEIRFLKEYKTSSEIRIPYSCHAIGTGSFRNNTFVEKVILPDSINCLPDGIFSGCTKLKTVEFGGHIRTIPQSAFNGCRELVSIRFGNCNENVIPTGTEIGPCAFLGCASLKHLVLPKDLKSVQHHAFGYCESLEIDELPVSLTSINDFAFDHCVSIAEIILPQSLERLGKNCFSNCSELTMADLSMTKLTSLGSESFINCSKLKKVELPVNIRKIGPCAFKNCHMLSDVHLGHTAIADLDVGAFQNCFSITEMNLPEGIERISAHCFKGCHSLEKIHLPKGLKSIENSAFYKCISLSGIDLPDSLESFGTAAFSYSGLTQIKIPDSVSCLSNGLFEHCSKLINVSIPSHISSITNDCFKDCGFSSIDLPDGLKTISVGAFKFCFNLEKIKIPDTVTMIDASAFRSCVNLKEIECPVGLKIVKKSVFQYCLSLERVKMGNIKAIMVCAFKDCRSLKEIDLSRVEKKIDYAAFQNCRMLKNVNFSNTISVINIAAFMGCSSIEMIKLPDSIEKVHQSSFRDNEGLKEVVLPNTDHLEIHKGAFSDCKQLEKVTVNSKKLYIESEAFKGCISLRGFCVPEQSTVYNNSFSECPDEKRIMTSENIYVLDETDCILS